MTVGKASLSVTCSKRGLLKGWLQILCCWRGHVECRRRCLCRQASVSLSACLMHTGLLQIGLRLPAAHSDRDTPYSTLLILSICRHASGSATTVKPDCSLHLCRPHISSTISLFLTTVSCTPQVRERSDELRSPSATSSAERPSLSSRSPPRSPLGNPAKASSQPLDGSPTHTDRERHKEVPRGAGAEAVDAARAHMHRHMGAPAFTCPQRWQHNGQA